MVTPSPEIVKVIESLEGESFKKICSVLGCSETTVRNIKKGKKIRRYTQRMILDKMQLYNNVLNYTYIKSVLSTRNTDCYAIKVLSDMAVSLDRILPLVLKPELRVFTEPFMTVSGILRMYKRLYNHLYDIHKNYSEYDDVLFKGTNLIKNFEDKGRIYVNN